MTEQLKIKYYRRSFQSSRTILPIEIADAPSVLQGENSMAETIQRGKIKKAPAAEIVQYLIRPAIEADLKRSYNPESYILRTRQAFLK